MRSGYMLIDANNIGFAASATKKLAVGDQPTNGVYGFLRFIRPARAMFPQLKPIVLWDGASWRKTAFEEYKAKRDDKPVTKSQIMQAEVRASWRSQKALTVKALKALGVGQLFARNLEADDLAAILVRRYQPQERKVVLVSADKDWLQLLGPHVSWFDTINDRRCTLAKLEEFCGVKTPRQWLEVKALMGDVSDEIPGVGGIGEKGAKELVNAYGSVSAFTNRVLDGTIDPKSLHKKFRELALNEDKQLLFARNMQLMDLNSPLIPKPDGMKVIAGSLSIGAFTALCEELHFKSILTDVDGWCEPFAGRTEE